MDITGGLGFHDFGTGGVNHTVSPLLVILGGVVKFKFLRRESGGRGVSPILLIIIIATAAVTTRIIPNFPQLVLNGLNAGALSQVAALLGEDSGKIVIQEAPQGGKGLPGTILNAKFVVDLGERGIERRIHLGKRQNILKLVVDVLHFDPQGQTFILRENSRQGARDRETLHERLGILLGLRRLLKVLEVDGTNVQTLDMVLEVVGGLVVRALLVIL